MNICPITYEKTEFKYSSKGLRLLSSNLDNLNDIAYSKKELLNEALTRAPKLSIQGVQPKLSAILNISKKTFELVDKNGKYIIKPQHDFYYQLPENEDLTMRLAERAGLNVPIHGLLYCKDGSLTYFIKRFDRIGRNKKVAVEDFAQLSGARRGTKYNSSMEKVVKIIDDYCTFPLVEKVKLFKITLFNFLVGNEDMHLKNFSMIRNKNKIEISPFYDLLNTTIAIKNAKEEIALPIRGRMNGLNLNDLINYFGKEICNLNEKVLEKILSSFTDSFDDWNNLIKISFLTDELKEKYYTVLEERKGRIFGKILAYKKL